MKKMVPVLLVLALVATVPAAASTFLAMSQAELVAQSDAVVVGEVLQVQSFRDETGSFVITEAMVQVDETFTGSADSVVVVRTAGGTVDGYTVMAHGFPQFETGERVVLFLSDDGAQASKVVGYRLGQYRVVTNSRGVEVALPTLEPGIQLLTEGGLPAPRPQALTLDSLREQVRSHSVRLDGLLEQ